jgi:TRAP-type mannitol/chloroaromatic compound transport system permease large subunit
MATHDYLVVAMLVTFIALLFTGFPIAWILAGVAVVFSTIAVLGYEHLGWDTYFLTSFAKIEGIFIQRIYAQMTNWILVALPMFVFMGLMLERSGVTEKLMVNFVQLFGRFRGGLALAVVLIGILLAASTGIVGASVVLLAVLSMPIMLAQGYNKGLASGVVASSGTLGILIPPSIMLIIMADQLSLSVGNLYFGALIPGLMLGLIYVVYIIVTAQLFPAHGARAHGPAARDREDDRRRAPRGRPAAGPHLSRARLDLLRDRDPDRGLRPRRLRGDPARGAERPAHLGGDQGGLPEDHRHHGLHLRHLPRCHPVRRDAAPARGDELISRSLQAIPFGPNGVVLTILFIGFVAGFFLDWLEISLIILPLVAPVVVELGFDLYWFVVLFAVMLQTSFLTPPVGFSLFYLKGVAPKEVTTLDIYKGIIPFVLCQLLAVFLLFEFPGLALWLPSVMFGAPEAAATVGN